MNYPERGASYKNRPAWLDRAVAGEKRDDGGEVSSSDRSRGVMKLRDEMGAKARWTGLPLSRTAEQGQDTMRGQMERAKDVSDAVPRRTERADGGMINSKLAQVAPEFEPAAAQDAREAAATRIRRGANDRLKTMNSPMKPMKLASDPEL